MEVVIITPSLVANDAVSNDVHLQSDALVESGRRAHIFAENVDHFFSKKVVSLGRVQELVSNPSNLLILHHSIYWEMGEQIFKAAKCPVIFKYHNITPAEFFPSNPEIQREISMGRLQNFFYASSKNINYFLSDSEFNSNELIQAGADPRRCHVLAPFTRVNDFLTASPDSATFENLRAERRIKLLFVGRVAPNKGQLNLVRLLKRYVEIYGTQVCLYIVGKLGPKSYISEIENYVNEHRLASVVQFVDNANFSKLTAYFKACDFFVMMSEHEGFGVPILEAQVNGLPILAYGVTAVPETAGPGQMVFDTLNFDEWCAAIKVLSDDPTARNFLIENGKINANKFAPEALTKSFLNLISNLQN